MIRVNTISFDLVVSADCDLPISIRQNSPIGIRQLLLHGQALSYFTGPSPVSANRRAVTSNNKACATGTPSLHIFSFWQSQPQFFV